MASNFQCSAGTHSCWYNTPGIGFAGVPSVQQAAKVRTDGLLHSSHSSEDAAAAEAECTNGPSNRVSMAGCGCATYS